MDCVALLFTISPWGSLSWVWGTLSWVWGNVPKPLTLLQGRKDILRKRGEGRMEQRHLLRCAKPAHPSSISPLVAPQSWA